MSEPVVLTPETEQSNGIGGLDRTKARFGSAYFLTLWIETTGNDSRRAWRRRRPFDLDEPEARALYDLLRQRFEGGKAEP